MYVHMCICISTHIYIYIYIHTSTYIYIYICPKRGPRPIRKLRIRRPTVADSEFLGYIYIHISSSNNRNDELLGDPLRSLGVILLLLLLVPTVVLF